MKSACMILAAELAALTQSESVVPDQICSKTERGRQLTAHDDVVTLPEELLVLELPLGPVLPEVDTVPQLLRSEHAVSEDEIVTALDERGLVVVGVWEDHDIVLLALSKEEMVGSLVVQTGRSIRFDGRCQAVRRRLTPVPTPPWLCGSLIVMVNM